MRKYLPTLAELIDRLSIAQLKEVFITEHKDEYAKEINDIIQESVGGRKDYKIDCLAAEFKDWEVSWNDESMD